MDDVASGANDEQQAYNLYKNAKETGGYNLRKFVSNSAPLQTKVDEEEQPADTPNLKEPVGVQEMYSKSTLGSPSLH